MRIRRSVVLAAMVAGLVVPGPMVGSSAAQAEGPRGAPCVGGPVTSAAMVHVVLDRTAVRGIFLAEIDDTGAEPVVCASWSLARLTPDTNYRVVIGTAPCNQTPTSASRAYSVKFTTSAEGRSTSLWFQALVTNESFMTAPTFRLYQGWNGSNQKACAKGLVTEPAS